MRLVGGNHRKVGQQFNLLETVMLDVGLSGWGSRSPREEGGRHSMSEGVEMERAGLSGNIGEHAEPGAHLHAQMTSVPRRWEKGSAGERTSPVAPALSQPQPGCFLLQLEFCVVHPWSDSHGLCDWSPGLLGPQVFVRGPCGA